MICHGMLQPPTAAAHRSRPPQPSSSTFCRVFKPVVSWLPNSAPACPAGAWHARQRARLLLLTRGSPSAHDLWHCWWEQGEGQELS